MNVLAVSMPMSVLNIIIIINITITMFGRLTQIEVRF
jgi:hypothetical protein